jgi:hypothetical protein
MWCREWSIVDARSVPGYWKKATLAVPTWTNSIVKAGKVQENQRPHKLRIRQQKNGVQRASACDCKENLFEFLFPSLRFTAHFLVFCRSCVGLEYFWAHIVPCMGGVVQLPSSRLLAAAAAGLFSSEDIAHPMSHVNSKSSRHTSQEKSKTTN